MNKTYRKLLQSAFDPPPPLHKNEFLRNLPSPPMSLTRFLCSQIGYIRKRIWFLDAVVLAAALLFAPRLAESAIWTAAALVPLMAVSVIAESGRSQRFGMSELEMASRFSLRSVIFSRLVILGGANIFVFTALIFVVGSAAGTSFLQTGVYLLCPYFITTSLCLWATRHIHSADSIYVCLGIAIFMSAIPLLHQLLNILAEIRFSWWIFTLAASAAGVIFEGAKTVKQMEVSYGISD